MSQKRPRNLTYINEKIIFQGGRTISKKFATAFLYRIR
ncbi:hypothetical protein LEP1GSC058_3871 [Leptospira fainei serovar Hurstbridge str. BUT 6]|uniref:Uncharacterized protein n=1 Tax=Leptospira fainei serovar Hurstbridge str. BUT 6 TaxID=1193011 RepID=S3V0F5_9LEPT|nr:hypothetical protein LEP1GSC058_3871 [Leptospira fainei serovar Hurstbridge str. BUT 6]